MADYGFGVVSAAMTAIVNNNDSDSDSREIEAPEYSDSSDSDDEVFKLEGEDITPKFTGMTSAKPSFWNGERWARMEGKKFELARKFQKTEFTIISWNVWFGTRNYKARLMELGLVIQQHDPDLIAFQEVTPEFMKIITSQKWAREYFISDQEGVLLERYGNVMFSKTQFRECVVKNLESRMGRKAMLGTFLVRGAPQLTFGTFHLESYLEDAPYRAKQLQVFNELTSSCSHVILVGDTNFVSDSEHEPLGNRFADAWKILHQRTPEEAEKNPGLTFDTETNPMLKEEYTARKMGTKRQRLDRCFFTVSSLDAVAMKILGTEPYDRKTEFISDHYGILVKLRFKSTT